MAFLDSHVNSMQNKAPRTAPARSGGSAPVKTASSAHKAAPTLQNTPFRAVTPVTPMPPAQSASAPVPMSNTTSQSTTSRAKPRADIDPNYKSIPRPTMPATESMPERPEFYRPLVNTIKNGLSYATEDLRRPTNNFGMDILKRHVPANPANFGRALGEAAQEILTGSVPANFGRAIGEAGEELLTGAVPGLGNSSREPLEEVMVGAVPGALNSVQSNGALMNALGNSLPGYSQNNLNSLMRLARRKAVSNFIAEASEDQIAQIASMLFGE